MHINCASCWFLTICHCKNRQFSLWSFWKNNNELFYLILGCFVPIFRVMAFLNKGSWILVRLEISPGKVNKYIFLGSNVKDLSHAHFANDPPSSQEKGDWVFKKCDEIPRYLSYILRVWIFHGTKLYHINNSKEILN